MDVQAVILDRDGTINYDRGYVVTLKQFEFIPGVIEALKLLMDAGIKIFVASNQSAIGRGMATDEEVGELMQHMERALRMSGVRITETLWCAHGPDEDCACRKPKPGMIDNIINFWDLDPKTVVVIGDSDDDVQAGKAANCLTRKVRRDQPKVLLECVKGLLHVNTKDR